MVEEEEADEKQNVSVIDLNTNQAIGAPVKAWSVWPDNVSGGGDDGKSTVCLS